LTYLATVEETRLVMIDGAVRRQSNGMVLGVAS